MSTGTLVVLEHLLYESDEPQYPLAICEATGLASGVVVPTLVALEHDEWVVSEWNGVDPAIEGRPRRRTYRLTPEGRQWALQEMAQSDFASDRFDTDAVGDWIPPFRLDDYLLDLFVRLLPPSARARFDEEVGGELAASRHPVEDAVSLLFGLPQMRRALAIPHQSVPWRCRLGRHEDVQIRTDRANHHAYYLQCLRCGRESNPSGGLEPTNEEHAAWMAGGGRLASS